MKENLKRTHLEDSAVILHADAAAAVRTLSGRGVRADLIFMDPPYGKSLEKDVLLAMKDLPLADTGTMIMIEASLETDFSYLESCGYSLIRTKQYKTNKHVFVRKV